MPKIKCLCDNVIEMISVPCPAELLMIQDSAIEEIAGAELAGADVVKWLDDRAIRVYECSNCKRLIVFWNDDCATYYRRE